MRPKDGKAQRNKPLARRGLTESITAWLRALARNLRIGCHPSKIVCKDENPVNPMERSPTSLRLSFADPLSNPPGRLLLIIFQPFKATLVGQMRHSEMLKFHVKPLTIRTCCHHSHLHRNIILHPCISHHRVIHIVE